MKQYFIIFSTLTVLLITSCKKENLLTPSKCHKEIETKEVETEDANSNKTVDYRNKFIGTYTGVSTGSTTAYGPSTAGTSFKFIVSKVPYVADKVKITVSISGNVVSNFTATANSTHLAFSGIISGNITQTIRMFKTSSTATATHFKYTTGGGFTGQVSTYVVLNPTKS